MRRHPISREECEEMDRLQRAGMPSARIAVRFGLASRQSVNGTLSKFRRGQMRFECRADYEHTQALVLACEAGEVDTGRLADVFGISRRGVRSRLHKKGLDREMRDEIVSLGPLTGRHEA